MYGEDRDLDFSMNVNAKYFIGQFLVDLEAIPARQDDVPI